MISTPHLDRPGKTAAVKGRVFVLALFCAALLSKSATASTLTRTSSFAYNSGTGLLTSETIEPTATSCNGNNTSCGVTTSYTYDAYGNKTAATVSGSGVTTRSTSSGYDSQGEFQTSAANALSQSESWVYDQRFGVPTSHTGPNGLTTTWSYDTFGRVTQENRPDGTKTVYTYINCATSGTCASGAAIAQSAVAYAPDGSTIISPTTTSYYNSLSRKIAVTTQGFNGATIITTIQYDANGRVLNTSRPYFQSGGTPHLTVNSYDTIGRVTQVSLPNGGSVTYAYHGLTTSATNDHGQTTTTVKNAQGLNAAITDALGHTTNYGYDAGGNLTSITDPYGNVTTNSYDIRGQKIASSDPDMGSWSYIYDVLGELVSQTDAKGQTATLSYDLLGRVTSRSENGQVSSWSYDTATHGIGKVAEAKACTSSGCPTVLSDRTFNYDSLGRPSSSATTVDGTANTYTQTYDSNGRPSTVAYPSGLTLQYVYTSLSYLSQVKDNSSGTAYWTANARDAEMHPVSQTFGNGVTQSNTYDPNTGFLTNVRAGPSDQVAAFDYNYDTLGNLNYRSDNLSGVFEYGCYDTLNRLTQYAVGNGVTSCTAATNNKQVTYDALGNITSKTGVGAYAYNASGSSRPHAVASIVGTVNGVVNPTYSYDANGNMTAGGGRTVSVTSFNMVAVISQGTASATFAYDDAHQRIKQTLVAGSTTTVTTYLNDPASGAMEDKAVTGSTTTWHDYILADGHIVAEKFSGTTNATRYFILDHLSSIAVVTNESGAVVERDFYDAWGKRRNADGSDDTTCSLSSQTTHGFTNQEEIDALCLVNLNARVYDPLLGRFMSPDSFNQDIYNLQLLNRYTYVGNNPLSFTDPTGHFFGIDDLFYFAISLAIDVGVAELTKNIPIIGDILTVLAGIECGPICAAREAAINTGVQSGSVGKALEAFVLTYAEANAFKFAGDISQGAGGGVIGHTLATFATHGLVGGIFSVASGGKFESGFLAAGVGSLGDLVPQFGPTLDGYPVVNIAINASLGGAASMLGGGKFENGAITAAFAYLYNNCNHPGPCQPTAKDQAYVKQEMTNCPAYGPCTSEAMQDAIDAAMAPNIDKELASWIGVSIGGGGLAAGCLSGGCEALSSKGFWDALLKFGQVVRTFVDPEFEPEPLPELPAATETSPEFTGTPKPNPQTTSDPVKPSDYPKLIMHFK